MKIPANLPCHNNVIMMQPRSSWSWLHSYNVSMWGKVCWVTTLKKIFNNSEIYMISMGLLYLPSYIASNDIDKVVVNVYWSSSTSKWPPKWMYANKQRTTSKRHLHFKCRNHSNWPFPYSNNTAVKHWSVCLNWSQDWLFKRTFLFLFQQNLKRWHSLCTNILGRHNALLFQVIVQSLWMLDAHRNALRGDPWSKNKGLTKGYNISYDVLWKEYELNRTISSLSFYVQSQEVFLICFY